VYNLSLNDKHKDSLVTNLDNTFTYSIDYKTYESPASSKEMASLYGQGFQIISKNYDYVGNGCGINQQGTNVPIESALRHYSTGIGYNPFKESKAHRCPTLNVNTISTLNLIFPEIIDTSYPPGVVPLDVFSTDEVIMEFLGTYYNIPCHHHKCGLPYDLNNRVYFGKTVDN